MPAVQKRAFPLAGLMYALRGIAYAHEGKAGITVPANASSSFSRRGDEESFETSTRTREGEFCESIKKGLPTITNPVYGYSAPAKSGVGRRNPLNIKATQTPKASFFVSCHCAHQFSGYARNVSMVALAGQPSGWPVSFVSGIPTPVNVTTNQERRNSGGDSLHTKEAAAMLATTPTQNPQFIWLIAAVRRDMPTITAKTHHIAAETEREARRTLARDHICFFAGRIRLEVAA
ncbi:TPA: ash family protein [Enterobacter hormaechei subsp. xiangfangensis]|nr:ash family protein [Enterobacter hormaechei subsp. xiangfangensis]